MIFLHIGKSKTGTTSIQEGLTKNRKILKDLGYLYPHIGIYGLGHHNIYFELMKDARYNPAFGSFKDLCNQLKIYKKRNPKGNIIISSETLEVLVTDERWEDFKMLFHILKSLNEIDRVTVLYAIRRQDEYIQSFWSMEISRMETSNTINEYISKRLQKNRVDLQYDRILAVLESIKHIHKIKLLSFKNIIQGGILSSFLKSCNLSEDKIRLLKTESLANTATTPLALEVLRNANIQFGQKLTDNRKAYLLECINAISKRNDWSGLGPKKKNLISTDNYNLISKKYSASNKLIKEKYPEVRDHLDFDIGYVGSPEVSMDLIPRDHLVELSIFSLVFGLRKTEIAPS